jgi:hypothetical protein
MTSYQLVTARTAEFYPIDRQLDYSGEQIYPLSDQSVAYPYVNSEIHRVRLRDILLDAISIPDKYVDQSDQIRKRLWLPRALIATPHHGQARREVVARSSATRPSANTVIKAILSAEADAMAVEGKELLSNASADALKHELRTAYRGLYRGLDKLLRSAKWRQVSLELDRICSERYPAAFGIAALRFTSDAAGYIPGWDNILKKLINTAKRQGVDIRRAMRGLVDTNGAK